MRNEEYQTPSVEYLEYVSEGILCASNEELKVIIGTW